MAERREQVDCIGLRGSEPILATARAARGLGQAGGVLELHADDAAFPIDLKSWCLSTNAELVSLEQQDQAFRALVRVPQKSSAAAGPPSTRRALPATPTPATGMPAVGRAVPPGSGAAQLEPMLLDYRGRRCPEPIVELAKAARNAKGPLEVLADDPAFPLDLKSWCRSSGARAELLSSDDSLHRVLIFPKGLSREMLVTTLVAPVSQASASQASASLAALPPALTPAAPSPFPPGVPTARFDLRGLPADAIDEELSQIGKLRPGMAVTLLVPPSAAQRAVRWCTSGDHELVAYAGEQLDLLLGKRIDNGASSALARPESSQALVPARSEGAYDCVLLVLHNDLESLLGALHVANTTAAQGMRTMLFFTFWGLNLLRADRPNLAAPKEPVSFMQRMFKWMMPKGPRRQGLGKLNFGGMGAAILGGIMQKKNIRDLPSLLVSAQEQDVRFIACTMSMAVMGIGKRDLEPYPNLEFGGVATFVEAGRHAQLTLMF